MWKRRIIIPLIFLAFNLYSKSIQRINFNKLENRNGLFYLKGTKKLYSGNTFEYCSNGKISNKKNLKNGKLGGKEEGWYCNGKKERVIYYYKYHKLVNIDFDKKFNEFIKKNSDKKDDELQKDWKTYRDKLDIRYYDKKYLIWYLNGVEKINTFYKKGKINGKYLLRWHNGNKMAESFYVNGKREGKSLTWWNNKKLLSEKYYQGDKLKGEYKEWYKNGILKRKLFYKNGKKDGFLEIYNRNGKLISKELYKNDNLVKTYNVKLVIEKNNKKLNKKIIKYIKKGVLFGFKTHSKYKNKSLCEILKLKYELRNRAK